MLRSIVKGLVSYTPYRVVRSAPNRFEAIEHCLLKLSQAGLRPKIIIDGGAHLGDFSHAINAIFPGAHVHMVEPQPACRRALEALASSRGYSFHPYALASEEGALRMWAGKEPTTGANIASEGNVDAGTVPIEATTLDRLFADTVVEEDRRS